MRERNRQCVLRVTGETGQPGKTCRAAGEEHTTNSNHMRRTPTVHSGDRTRVLRGDKRESNFVATRAPDFVSCILRLRLAVTRTTITLEMTTVHSLLPDGLILSNYRYIL